MKDALNTQKYGKLILLIFAAALFGFSSVIIPSTFQTMEFKPYPVFPAIFTALDNMSLLAYPLLLISGFVLGIIEPQRPILLGLATMSVFPVMAMIEKAMIISSHPNYPIEFLYYLLLGAIAVGGAFLGRHYRPKVYRLLARS